MRDTKLTEVRDKLIISTKHSSPIETFQNKTLRQILKFQHPITLDLLVHSKYFEKKLNSIDKSDLKILIEFVKTQVSNNKSLRHQIIGIVIGMMTKTEFDFYLKNTSKLNKRIISMQIKRFVDTISGSE